MTDLDRRTKTAINQAIHYRNYRRVRDRALRRLGQENPERYRELLDEERARDEAEGKAWLDLSGRTMATDDSTNAPNRGSKVSLRQTGADNLKARNVGGEA